MKGMLPLFLGIFGTFAFSWAGLVMVPNFQIGHLDPQMDEEGGDVYPAPKSGMADRGRQIYAANGCVYCHSQQVRAEYAASDIERKWGERRSAPRDYLFERPALLGKMRMGPDLANIGNRASAGGENPPPPPAAAGAAPPAPAASPGAAAAVAAPAPAPAVSPGASAPPALAGAAAVSAPAAPSPAPESKDGRFEYSAAWHHQHLFSPRGITQDSTMPSYRFLYEKRRITGEPSAEALKLTGNDAPPTGWEVVPTYEAKCLVAYLMSLDQSHALNEVKPVTPLSPPAPGKEVK